MTWQSADDPPNNSRTVSVVKKSARMNYGAAVVGVDYFHEKEWANAVRDEDVVLKWQDLPKIEE